MRCILLCILFASLGLTSGCQTKTGQFLNDCFNGPSPGEEAYTKAVMEDFQKNQQKLDEMFAEVDREAQELIDEHNKRNAPFDAAMAEYERWYNSLSASEKYTVDSVLEQKMIHRRIMQGPNGVGVYDHCYDEQEVMAEYKQFFGH